MKEFVDYLNNNVSEIGVKKVQNIFNILLLLPPELLLGAKDISACPGEEDSHTFSIEKNDYILQFDVFDDSYEWFFRDRLNDWYNGDEELSMDDLMLGRLLLPYDHIDRMTRERFANWMQTKTGKHVDPLNMSIQDICIEDIAHALGMQCRYNGHCNMFYSVAEHSVLVSRYVDQKYALEALLHDGSEAYICDIPRPLKPYLSNYKEIESKVQSIVYDKFEVKRTVDSESEVKRVDNAILADEAKHLMGDPSDWTLPEPPLGITHFNCWIPDQATASFLYRYKELTGQL